MVYIFLLIFLFAGLPFAHAENRKVLDLSTSYPSPFGMYQRLDTKYLRMTPIPPTEVQCTQDLFGYMYVNEEDKQTYICQPPDWTPYTPGLWEEIDTTTVHSIYPTDIQDRNSPFSVGIGTTTPLAKLHIVSDDQKTTIRLDDELGTDSTYWELGTHRDLGNRSNLFAIFPLNPATKNPESSTGLFMTRKDSKVSFHLAQDFTKISAPAGSSIDPTLNVQRQADALTLYLKHSGNLIVASRKVNVDKLAATFTNNTNNTQAVGIGFGVDLDPNIISSEIPQQYGAAIVHERTGENSMGKLHFATRNSDIANYDRLLPVQMTLDENGNLGLGTTSPQFQLSLEGDEDSDGEPGKGGILSLGKFGHGPTVAPLKGAIFLWYPKKAALRAGEFGQTGGGFEQPNLDSIDDHSIGEYSVAFGKNSTASGAFSVVSGGKNNYATGKFSTVAGGESNRAQGDHSFAAGQKMIADAEGVFIFGNKPGHVTASQKNTFIIMSDRVGIGTTNPRYKLHVENGDLYVDGNIYYTGEPKKVSPWDRKQKTDAPSGFDVAELFDTTEEVEAGDVLVADPKGTVKLQKSRVAYEKSVIGIASSNPAIIFDDNENQPAEEFIKGTKPPVALAGRVPCKVTNENGPIEVGDLLTSSSIPGHAMKATDREKSFGAIMGKALEPFTQGPKGESTGKIIVFVTM